MAGGLVGYNDAGIITNSYWDTETSGQSSSDGGTGKTTAEMKQQATFSSWDFTNIWAIEEDVTYPYLQWQHAAAEPPTITSFTPPTPVSNIAEATQTFNITIDQTVNVTWYINGTNVLDANTSVTAASYTNASAETGVWNVSAVAENANGTDMQMWVWNVIETTPPVITIDAPTPSDPVLIAGGEQFWVNFTYTELYPANYTVAVGNATAVIHLITNESVAGGTGMTVNASFNLNASAADGWYNVTVEMYDNSSNYNITHQNNSVEKGSYDASISQPENQTTEPGVNATYELNITNTGSFAGAFTLAVTNHDGAGVAALKETTITDLAIGASQNVTLNVTDASAGTYNVTVNVTSTYSGNEVASTGYIMTAVVGPTLALGNVAAITSDWGINFSVNHSVAATNAAAKGVNVTYNVSWILNNDSMGTIAKDGMKWHNQTRSNSTVQKITVKVNANTTTASATNASETFSIDITRRDINVTADPGSEQTAGVGETFWINGSAKDEHNEAFFAEADLIRDGSIVATTGITNGNANFSTNESAAGTSNFSVRFHNTSHYNNASTSNKTVTVRGPTLSLDNVAGITSDWGINFSVNHSVTVTNAAASNVNVTYNVSWIDECVFGIVNKDVTDWCNHSIKNSTVQNLMVKVDATTTTGSATNDTKTFSILITRRNITVTADPGSEQTAGVGETFWINGSAKDEHNEAFFAEADLIRDGSIVATTGITNGNANFSTNESAAGTSNFSVRFHNTSHYNNASTSNSTVTVRGPTLSLDNVAGITSDWGINFSVNHSVTVTNAAAKDVNVTYNVSWILNNDSMGTIAKDGMRWHNQTPSNLTVQKITVKVNANTTTASATNDSETFSVNITRRNIVISSQPATTQSADPGMTFWINASARSEYKYTLIAKADLIREGVVTETQDISGGNAKFSMTEPLAGTFNYSIRFHNTTHYNNESTSNSSVTIVGPTLTLGNVTAITSEWGRDFDLNHLVTVTNASASNVNVTYNVSWIVNNDSMGTIAKDGMRWHNQTPSNLTVQKITVKVNANTTTASATNDSETFSIDITRRAIIITSDPVAPQSVNPNTTFWINGSAEGNYSETFIGEADLIRDGSIIENHATTDGNANFSRTESAEGTFNFSIRFYNMTHYNNETTSNATMRIVDDTPPASITGLDNLTTEQSRIRWTWTDPTDIDFAEVMIYLDGTFKTNVSKGVRNYNATGLDPDTNYTIGTHTVDDKGNVNRTWENDTARTLPFSGLQRINVMPDSWTLNISESINFNAIGYDHNDDPIDPANLTFAWYTTPSGVGTLNATTGSVVNFTARHAGRTEIYAINGSVSSNAIDSVWITVNAPPETEDVTNGTGNATSGNSTAIVMLNDTSVNGTIIIEELGDPLNRTEDIGNRTGLGTDSEPVKGVNVTVNKSIVAALNDTGGYVHIRVEYNESQLGGIDENTLYVYKFVNGTGWVKLVAGNPSYCTANGRNTTADYVWVNVTNCSIFLLASIGVTTPTPSGGGGGEGTYPPGWFATPAPAVTATKAPSATATATDAPPGDKVTPASTKKPAAAKATTPAAEGTTAGAAKKGAPGFTAVFAIAGLLAVAYAMMRRRG